MHTNVGLRKNSRISRYLLDHGLYLEPLIGYILLAEKFSKKQLNFGKVWLIEHPYLDTETYNAVKK